MLVCCRATAYECRVIVPGASCYAVCGWLELLAAD